MKLIRLFIFSALLMAASTAAAQKTDKPLRLGIAGLSHGHVWEVISRLNRGDFEVVGVAEKNTALWNNKELKKKVKDNLFYEDLGKMLDETKPEAVIVYESTYDHLRVVKACAPRGVHVMVEKPLATSILQAKEIAELARAYDIMVLTNYETTWYPANHEAYKMINKGDIGHVSRINVYDGHQGPVEIGCSPEFLKWLTDSTDNGGGAVMDFGCYGANIATWLKNGERPISVYALLQQYKPSIYPDVDDDATILLEYRDGTTVVIQASWNWPMSRKDMRIYGDKGYIYQDDAQQMRINTNNNEKKQKAKKLPAPYNDPFLYLKAAVRGEITVSPTDLSALENNLIVVEILETAINSNYKGEVIMLDK